MNHPRSDRTLGKKSLPFHQGIGSKNLAIYTPPKSWLCGLKILECWLLPIFFLECWLLRLGLSMVNPDFWLKKILDADFCPKNGGYKVWMLTSATPPYRPPWLIRRRDLFSIRLSLVLSSKFSGRSIGTYLRAHNCTIFLSGLQIACNSVLFKARQLQSQTILPNCSHKGFSNMRNRGRGPSLLTNLSGQWFETI